MEAEFIQIVLLLVVWIYLGRMYGEIVRIRKAIESNRSAETDGEDRGKQS